MSLRISIGNHSRPRRGSSQPFALVLTLAALALGALPAGGHAAGPADPLMGEQWAFSPAAILDLPGAWAISHGRGVVVAIVDSGVRVDHPDLAPNVWTNFAEVPGNHVDDDGNGYVDDVHGIDLTTAGSTNDVSDSNGHGTHVAGIVAAAANRKGVVGVAPDARIMVVKTQRADGTGSMQAVADGIAYAVAEGAKVVNVSLSSRGSYEPVRQAIEAAGRAGVLVVAAAGNEASDDDRTPVYPAGYAEPNLVAVAATTPSEGRNLAGFSNYGRTTVQLAAPGDAVLSTVRDGGYGLKSGTSMAAPVVAGVAALVAAANPGISAEALRAQLLASAGRTTLPVAGGYLDAGAAVRGARSSLQTPLRAAPDVAVLSARAAPPRRGRTRVELHVTISGPVARLAGYDIMLGRRRVASLGRPETNWTARLAFRGRVLGRRLTVVARTRDRHAIARGHRVVRPVGRTKSGLGRGPRTGPA
jgi:subtilisin family serine protease